MSDTEFVLLEVESEREQQDARWGQQNHPDGTGAPWHHNAVAARRRCEASFAAGEGTWHDILREEYAEAMAEDDPARLREELIQVAAVAVAWVEAIDRRAAEKPPPMTRDLLEQINAANNR